MSPSPSRCFPAAIVLCAACADGVTLPPGADAEFTLETPDVWVGDTILVRSEWIRALGLAAESTITVALDSNTLRTWYAGGDSLAALAPPDPMSGMLALRFSSGRADLGPVRSYGYLGAQTGVPVIGVFQPWPLGSPIPTVLAYGDQGMVRVDLRYGTAALLVPYDSASTRQCNWGPGPTNRPNAIAMCRRVWELTAAPLAAESIPGPGWRLTAVLAQGARIDLFHHDVGIRDALGGFVSYGTEESDQIRVSPRGDRAAIKAWTGFYPYISGDIPPAGYPVWDSLGRLAFAVGRLEGLGVVPMFSLTGDTLFAASTGLASVDAPDTLFVINADDGTVHVAVPLPEGLWPTAVAADPDAPRVYVFGWQEDGGGLAVIDLETAAVDAHLPSAWFRGENPEIVFDRPRRELYVAFGDNWGTLPPVSLVPLRSIRIGLRP